jgi:hypothetical protein
MTDSKTEAKIDSARGGMIKGNEVGINGGLPNTLSLEQKKQMDEAFDLFDIDKDKRIDFYELKVCSVFYY